MISSSGIVGIYFIEDDAVLAVIVNVEQYKVMLESFLANELDNVTYQYGFNKMGSLLTLHEAAW
jgi:hypothetical protein